MFEGCSPEGLGMFRATFGPSDEPLPGGMPTKLWVAEIPRRLKAHIASRLDFRVQGLTDGDQVPVRVANTELSDTYTIEEVPRAEAA